MRGYLQKRELVTLLPTLSVRLASSDYPMNEHNFCIGVAQMGYRHLPLSITQTYLRRPQTPGQASANSYVPRPAPVDFMPVLHLVLMLGEGA